MSALTMIARCMCLQDPRPDQVADWTTEWLDGFWMDGGDGRRPVLSIKEEVYVSHAMRDEA